MFGQDKLDFLREYFPFEAGIPCKNTFARVRFKRRISVDRRFFISSLSANAKEIAQTVRAHWAIESTLHGTLDVVFNEDQSTVGKDHAPQNMAIVRHVVFNILNTAKKHFKGIGIKALRKKAGWSNDHLRLILKHNF